MEEGANVVAQFSPQMKAELQQAGQAIKNCVPGENIDRNALKILFKAFKIAAAQCQAKSADGGPVLDLEHFSLIVKSVVGTVERRAVEKLFKQVDSDGNGHVDFGEFIGSARVLAKQVAAQEDSLNPVAHAAVTEAWELIDSADKKTGDGKINMGQDLDRVLRLLSLDADDIELLQRFELYNELELNKEQPSMAEGAVDPSAQKPIDSIWLKTYSNAMLMKAKDRPSGLLQQADNLANDLEITIETFGNLIIPYQQDIETIVPLLDQAFRTFDRDGSGSIDEEELRVVMASLGQKGTEASVRELMRAVDDDNSGSISFAEFVRFMADRAGNGQSQAQLHGQISSILTLFSVMDTDKSGHFTIDEMIAAMRPVGAVSTRRELEMSYQRAGGQGDLGCFLAMASSSDCPKGLKTFVFRLRAVRELFSLFDENDGGDISVDELSSGLTKYLGWRPTRFESEKMLAMVDTGGNGRIDFSEFYAMMGIATATDDEDFIMTKQVKTLQQIKDQLEAIQSMFTIFDTDADGLVDFQVQEEHMTRIVSCLGQTWPTKDVTQICKEISKGYEMCKGRPSASFRSFCEMVVDSSKSALIQKLLDHLKSIKQLFLQWDDDGSGGIDASELTRILKMLGGYRDGDESGDREVEKLVDNADADGNGDINFVEFVILLAGNGSQTQLFVKQQIDQLREAFDMFDRSNNGAVHPDDFWRMAYLCGMTDQTAIEEMLAYCDTDDDGMVDFVEFVGMMTGENTSGQVELRGHLAGFREAFNLFDVDGVGSITAKQFHNAVKMLGYKMSAQQINELIAENDDDGTGALDFAEFVEMLATSSMVMNVESSQKQTNIAADIAQLRESFTLFDMDCDGVLSFQEIKMALKKLGAFTSDASLWNTIRKVDDDGNGNLSFPEFAAMVSMCKDHGSEEDERRLAEAAEKEKNTQPFHLLREALQKPPDERHENELNTILQQVRGHLNIRVFKDMDDEVALGVCREMKLETMTDGEVLLKEGTELFRSYIILDGSVQVWNRANGPRAAKDLQCGGGLWAVAEAEVEAIAEETKRVKIAWPGGAASAFSPEAWSLMQNLEAIYKSSLRLLGKGRACMRHDLDQVLRPQEIKPEFGSEGKEFIELLRQSLTMSEAVRKEYLGHETAVKMSGLTRSTRGQRVHVILDLSVKLQSFLLGKIERLAPVYDVVDENYNSKLERTMSALRGTRGNMSARDWSKPSKGDAVDSEDIMENGKLTAQLRPGYIIGNAMFKEGILRCPATCVCNVERKVEKVTRNRGKKRENAKKQWKKVAKNEGPETLSMQVIVIARRHYQISKSAEPRKFLETLPYFADLPWDHRQIVAESFSLKTLTLNNFLVRRGQAADMVFLVKSGQLKILLQINQPTRTLTDGASFATASKSETYDAAILGPGDVIEESELLPDDTRVHTADIMAASCDVVVYSVPHAIFYKYAAVGEVSKERNSRRTEFISRQTELKPMQRLDQNKISAVRNRRIVLQSCTALPPRDSVMERAKAVIESRKNTMNTIPKISRKKQVVDIMPADADFRNTMMIMKHEAVKQETDRGSGAASCPLPTIRCASPTIAKCPKAGYSVMARSLHRKANRGLIHEELAKQLKENKYLSILEQEDVRINAEKSQALTDEVQGASDEQKDKKRMLHSLHEPGIPEFIQSKHEGLPALCKPEVSDEMPIPRSKFLNAAISEVKARLGHGAGLDLGATYVGTKYNSKGSKPIASGRTRHMNGTEKANRMVCSFHTRKIKAKGHALSQSLSPSRSSSKTNPKLALYA